MTDPTDDLMNQLAGADPVDRQHLPSAHDASAQQLLENTMSTDSVGADRPSNISPIAAAGDENPYAWPATESTGGSTAVGTPVVELDQGRRRRNPLMLLSAAAAVLLLVGGLLVFAPDNTPSAVATVHSAAAATADIDSARITTTFELDGTDGVEDERVAGQFDAAYAGNDISFSLDINDQPDEFFGDDVPITEALLIDDIAYVDTGDGWIAVDTDGLLGNVVSDFVDPRAVLETVQELTEVSEVGTATVDGVETTHYQSIVDLADGESLAKSGWLSFDPMDVDTEGEITVDVFVDGDGVLRQLDLTGDVESASDASESGTFDISTRFYDLGSDISIEAPADVEVLDPLQGLFADE